MAEYIDREALLHDIEQSVVYTVREKITSAEMRGAHKVIERIKCAPAVEPIYIHEPTKSEFKRMAAQMGYVLVVRCKDCKYYKSGKLLYPNKFCFRLKHPTENRAIGYNFGPDDFCSYGEPKEG